MLNASRVATAYFEAVRLCVGNISTSTNTKTGSQITEEKKVQYKDVFEVGETIFLEAVVTWPDMTKKSSGRHKFEARWLADGENPVAQTKYSVAFFRGQGEGIYYASIKSAGLGVGKHAVELSIDGQKVSRKEFEVKEQSPAP